MRSTLELQTLLSFVNDDTKKQRTSLVMCHHSNLGRETELAARMQLTPVDYVSWKLTRLPSGARFAQIDQTALLNDVRSIGMVRYQHNSVLLYNIDIALAHPRVSATLLWRDAMSYLWNLKSGIVLLLHDPATGLAPSADLLKELHEQNRFNRLGPDS